jgi:SAM-dependent methyltransferase
METVFSDIYHNNSWGDPESVSGRGSTLWRTEVIRTELPSLLSALEVKSLLDAACGDFNWMQRVDLGQVKYVGVDVVPELIKQNRLKYEAARRTFVVLDITRAKLPQSDVILCRDCFIHLSFRDIQVALDNFERSGSFFLLATTHIDVRENTDVESGGWRPVNLCLPPFSFPAPLRLITEDAELGKCLGLWQLKDLLSLRDS